MFTALGETLIVNPSSCATADAGLATAISSRAVINRKQTDRFRSRLIAKSVHARTVSPQFFDKMPDLLSSFEETPSKNRIPQRRPPRTGSWRIKRLDSLPRSEKLPGFYIGETEE